MNSDINFSFFTVSRVTKELPVSLLKEIVLD
jgi:hypothetical protein